MVMDVEELEQIVKYEIIQREEEGFDIREVKERFLKLREKSYDGLMNILKALELCSLRHGYLYKEPSSLSEIVVERPKNPRRYNIDLSDSEIYDKIYGGWLGRCVGCLLGKPVEGLNKDQIGEWLRIADEYPLRYYFPAIDISRDTPQWLKERVEWGKRLGLLRGYINRMPRDDDIDYTIINLYILENYGHSFTTMDIGRTWISLLPYLQLYTAERSAYRNLVIGLKPPQTAIYMNPFREWIGAQIRADIWGYISPGDPEKAANLAYRDACLSHTKNGIYGEMFVSAMIATAFATNNIEEIIDSGLSVTPKNSRLAEAIRKVLRWSKEYSDWRDTLRKIYEEYGHYSPIHTINNAAIVIMGLLYGNGDFEKTITITIMSGLDTDCNGATVGSILGVVLGAKALPQKWISPLNDTIESSVIGYNNIKISELAVRTYRIAIKNMK